MNARQHLEEASVLSVHCLDGGWLISLPGLEAPLACRVPADVLEYVAVYLGTPDLRLPWGYSEHACEVGSGLFVSKVDSGFLLSTPCGTPFPGMVSASPKAVRFFAREVLSDIGAWLGLQDEDAVLDDSSGLIHLTLYEEEDGGFSVIFAEETSLSVSSRTRVVHFIAHSLGELRVMTEDTFTFRLA